MSDIPRSNSDDLLAHQGVIRRNVVDDCRRDVLLVDVHLATADDLAPGMLQQAFDPLGMVLGHDATKGVGVLGAVWIELVVADQDSGPDNILSISNTTHASLSAATNLSWKLRGTRTYSGHVQT